MNNSVKTLWGPFPLSPYGSAFLLYVLKLLQSSSFVTIESVHTLMVENCVTFQDGLKFETLKRYVCTKHKHSLIFLPEKHCRSLSFTCLVLLQVPKRFVPAQKFDCIYALSFYRSQNVFVLVQIL